MEIIEMFFGSRSFRRHRGFIHPKAYYCRYMATNIIPGTSCAKKHWDNFVNIRVNIFFSTGIFQIL